MSNERTFFEITNGNYGRKIIYADVEEVTIQNIVSIIGNSISTFYRNREQIEYLWNYYHGDQPIKYRKKESNDDIIRNVVENHALEVVQFLNQQTYGEPLQYISKRDNEKVSNSVAMLIDFLSEAFKQARDIEGGEWQFATGTSFRAIQLTKNKEMPFRIIVPSPLNTFIVYSSITKEPILSVEILRDHKGQQYYQCFTKTHQCIVKNSKVYDWNLHIFRDIPIVEYPNNASRLSAIEIVCDLLDAVNNMQSCRIEGIEQFIQAWIKFENCEIDEETFNKMKESRALVVKTPPGVNGKANVEMMCDELNQEQTQISKEDILENIYTILAIPTKQHASSGGDTQGAIQLKNGWDFSKGRAKLSDPFVIESDKRLVGCILNILNREIADFSLSKYDLDIKIHHSPLDNMIIKAQFLDYLLKDGVHPEIAFERSTLFADSEKAYNLSKPYLDRLYKVNGDNAIDTEKEKELVDLFLNWLEIGLNPSDIAERLGIDEEIIQNSPSLAKWNYEETE